MDSWTLTFPPRECTRPIASSLSRLMFPPKTVVSLARSYSITRFGKFLIRLTYAKVSRSACMSSVRNRFTISATMFSASMGVFTLPEASLTIV